jgi:prefoldin subunit 4
MIVGYLSCGIVPVIYP